jgi:hypothetical protein
MAKALGYLTAIVLGLGAVTGCDSPRSAQQGNFFFPTGQQPSAESAPPAQSTHAPATGYKGLGVESVPPEVLEKYAAPALPADKSRLIQAMLDVRAPSGGLVSADGKRMFFTWSVTGTVQVWRLDGSMSFPVQLTGGEDTTSVSGLTPDGKTLLVTRDRSGEENPGLYMMSAEGGALTAIQHTPKVQTFLQWVADDNKTIYYRANDQSPESYAIYRYDLSTKKKETAFAEPGIWSLADVRKAKDGADKLLLFKSVGSNMEEFYEYDTAKKQLVPLFGQNEREDHEASYGPEEGEVIVLTPKLGEYRRLYSFTAGKLTPISAEIKFDVSHVALDRT